MWHGLPAREITAKMAVPPIKQLRLNTYPVKLGAKYSEVPIMGIVTRTAIAERKILRVVPVISESKQQKFFVPHPDTK